MRLLIICLLISITLMLGCIGGPSVPPAPDYTPKKTATQTPPQLPAKNITNATKEGTMRNQTASKINATIPQENNTKQETANNSNASLQNNASASQPSNSPVIICNGATTEDALDCILQAAIERKDVTICAQLEQKDSRYKCFNFWCYSKARDFKQCYKLNNTDDKLSCLSKCSPNFNR